MSEKRQRFLRATRLGGVVALGVDGKPRQPDDPLSGLVGGTPSETQEAVDIVEEAQRRADDLVRQAALEASSIRERAQQAGHALGYEQGLSKARTELAQSLALVQSVAAEAKAVRDELLRRSEREMVEMVIAGLRAVLGEWAEHDPAVVQHMVRRALERAGSQNVVRIRVHPDQVQGVTAYLASDHTEAPVFDVYPDGAITVGGCVVDTRHGRVDARLDAQLDAIAQMLRDAIPAEGMPVPLESLLDLDLDIESDLDDTREAADAA